MPPSHLQQRIQSGKEPTIHLSASVYPSAGSAAVSFFGLQNFQASQAMESALHRALIARSTGSMLLLPPRQAEPRPRPAVPCSSATLRGAGWIRSSDIRAPHDLMCFCSA